MNIEKIGEFITELRKDKNMTQKELAEKLGVTDRAVSNWENGRRMPDPSLMLNLCSNLGITLNELFAGEKIKGEDFSERAEENLLELAKENKKYKVKSKRIKFTFLAFLSVIIIVLSIVFFVHKRIENSWIGSTDTIAELEDGWYYSLTINYHTKNIAEYIIGKGNSKYIGDCYQEYSEKVKINACRSNYTKEDIEFEKESLRISKYFNIHQFNRTITEKDLKGLKLEYYDKKVLVELYNNAIKKNPEKGKNMNLNINSEEIRYDEFADGYRVLIGSRSSINGIQLFKIDIEYDNKTFLSDLVLNNKATEKQEKIYNFLQEISSYFIETEDIHIREKFDLKGEVYHRVFQIIESFDMEES